MKGEKFAIKAPISGFESVIEAEFAEIDEGAMAVLDLGSAELALINPYKVREYSLELPVSAQTLLDIKENSKVKVFCSFMQDKSGISVNFLAPFVLNCDNKTMAQVMLDAKSHPNYKLAEPIKNYIK